MTNKKYILIGLLALGISACNTDDLERDINALKERVENYEAQVQRLNDDMNIIRVLLDGNKSISGYTVEGDTYVLTLSNGETVRLTQGVDGSNYPSVEIGENSNWIIAGVDTGKRAQAQDGIEAPFTPQFKIEDDTWWVSYNDGESWTNLNISAANDSGVTANSNPVTSVVPEGNTIKITLTGGGEYYIPIIENLKCQITDPNSSELLYIPYGGDKTLKVDVELKDGDIVRPVVPADWKAEIVTENYNTAGVKTLEVKVTAPNIASKCVVTIEVNRGINTITDEIVARTETSSYYDDYMAGFDIEIGGVKINRKEYSDYEVINSSNASSFTKFEDNKIYFISADVTPKSISTVSNLVLINSSISEQPKVIFNGSNYLQLSSTEENCKGLLFKGISVDASTSLPKGKYAVTIANQNVNYDNLIWDDCKITLGKKSTGDGDNSNYYLFYFSSGIITPFINNLVLTNSLVEVVTTVPYASIFHLNPSAVEFKNSNVDISINVFYCRGIADLRLCIYGSTNINVLLQNNTFINVAPHNSQAYLQFIPTIKSKVTKNAIIISEEFTGSIGNFLCFINSKKDDTTIKDVEHSNFNDNIIYDSNNSKKWVWFRNANGIPEGFVNAISLLQENPRANPDSDTDFTLKEEWSLYGAK